MMTLEDVFEDTTVSLDLENIRNKITSAYQNMLKQVFKKNNPVGSSEELEKFIEENELNFGETGDFEEDTKNIEEVVDRLIKEKTLEPLVEDQKEKLDVAVKRNTKGKTGGLFKI
jgi:hypothetical protein|tara:strand:- start:798 stop:1142 length:345 start_codon:yes stop_codon:yes gene_type:complete